MSNPYVIYDEPDRVESNDFNITSELIDINLQSLALNESIDASVQFLSTYDTVLGSLDILGNLASHISEYGISSSVMQFIDKDNYLSNALGFPSTLNLSNPELIDENNKIALEAINDKLSSWITIIIKYFNAMIDMLKKTFNNVVRMFNSYNVLFKKFDKRFRSFKFDEAKGKDKVVKSLPAKVLVRSLDAISASITEVLNIDMVKIFEQYKDDPKFLKSEYDLRIGKLQYEGFELNPNTKEDDIVSLGYNKNTVRGLTAAAISLSGRLSDSEKFLSKYDATIKAIIDSIERLDDSQKESSAIRQSVNIVKTYLGMQKSLIIQHVTVSTLHLKYSLAICKAYNECAQ